MTFTRCQLCARPAAAAHTFRLDDEPDGARVLACSEACASQLRGILTAPAPEPPALTSAVIRRPRTAPVDDVALDHQLELFAIVKAPCEGSLSQRFAAFHKANPHIYRALRALALAAKRAGWRRGSINLYFERLRWSWAVKTNGGEYKLANAHRAYYARALMAAEPELSGFFKLSALRDEWTADLEALGLSGDDHA